MKHRLSDAHLRPETEMDYFQKWRRADQTAFAAERAVFAASMEMIERDGLGPSAADQTRSKELRKVANGYFDLAMVEMRDWAREFRH
ncbi:hypothetical protein [Caenimonas soli]|uniref:hypothetical protein n=1 Tax=Caenimonas soli TaxID=2735555 RepID=UPI0015561CA1|nr:hypothetical protein [Caenimonas soli]NPC55088.1 hypothetical protein [Caenimonas soli]